MDAVRALKVESARAQLELDGITGLHGHEQCSDDIDLEWDDGRETSAGNTAPEHSRVGSAEQDGQQNRTSPPAQSAEGMASRQDSAETRHEDPTSVLLSGMLFQQLSESRGGVSQSTESMAATLKNVLIATGIAVDDADIDAPLDYVEQMFAQLGLRNSTVRKDLRDVTDAAEVEGCTAKAIGEGTCKASKVNAEAAKEVKETEAGRRDTTRASQHASSSLRLQQGVQPPGLTENSECSSPNPNLARQRSQAVTRVPIEPSTEAVDAADLPCENLPQTEQHGNSAGNVQVIRHIQHRSYGQNTQPAQLAQMQSQTNPHSYTYEAWDSAAHSRCRPESLTQVAAAAAVAAAQAVKSDSDSELSQVLKAVLLQQSSLGMQNSALAAAVTGPASLNLHNFSGAHMTHRNHRSPTPLQATQAVEPGAQPLSSLPQPYCSAPTSPSSLEPPHLAVEPQAHDDTTECGGVALPKGQLDAEQGRVDGKSHVSVVPKRDGSQPKRNNRRGAQPSIKKKNSKEEAHRDDCPMPQRLRGSILSTKAPAPATRPATPATQPTSPASPPTPAHNSHSAVDHAHHSPPDGAKLQPAASEGTMHTTFQASVDAALASVCPEKAALRATLELPQPDFAGKARSNLKRMLGDDISYINIKCTARSAAAEANNELMAFKRSVSAAAPLLPTQMYPSWHSIESMDDVGVFADACVQEVALRAAQVQNDVSDGVYDLSHACARNFRSQAAARALQQLTARQNLAITACEEKDEAALAMISSAGPSNNLRVHNAKREGPEGAAVLGDKRPRLNPGRNIVCNAAADEQSGVRAPLQDGMIVKRGGVDNAPRRAQVVYERAVARGRARPVIAFGRRLEDTSRGDAVSDAHENAQPASEASPPAAAASAAPGRMARGTTRPKDGRLHHRSPDDRKQQQDRQERPHQEHQMRSHQYGHPELPSQGIDEWDQGGGWQGGMRSGVEGCQPPQGNGQVHSAATAPSALLNPSSSSGATDSVLVALLQGFTEIIRSNSLAPLHPMLPAPPAWPAHAAQPPPPPPLPPGPQEASQHIHASVANKDNAVPQCQHEPRDDEAIDASECRAGQAHSGAGHSQAKMSSVAAQADIGWQSQEPVPCSTATASPAQSAGAQPSAATVAALARHLADRKSQGNLHSQSAAATSTWAAFGHRTPPKFLSVVDIGASSIDQDFSSDGGRASEANGDVLHGVDASALDDLISASVCGSVHRESEAGQLQLTPEEASILKAVVKDLTAAQSAVPLEQQRPGQTVVEAGWHAAPGDEQPGGHLSDAASGKVAESALTMQQAAVGDMSLSPHRGSCSGSEQEKHRGTAAHDHNRSGTPSSSSVDDDAVSGDIVMKSAEGRSALQSATRSGRSNRGSIEGGCEMDSRATCALQPQHRLDTDRSCVGSSAVQQLPPSSEREPVSSHACSATAGDLGNASIDMGADAKGQLPCPDGGVECGSMTGAQSAHHEGSVGSSSVGVQAQQQPSRTTLQERIRERYAELREQSKAALQGACSRDGSPAPPLQPLAPSLHRLRRSSSPDTPTDLSIASLCLDPVHVDCRCGISRAPPLVASTDLSESSRDAGKDPSLHQPATGCEVPMSTDTGAAPCAHSKYHLFPQQSGNLKDDEAASRGTSSHDLPASEQLPYPHHGEQEELKHAKGNLADSCHNESIAEDRAASAAAVHKAGGAALPSAIQDLLRPVVSITDDSKISGATTGLDQYANLRCRLWRPPEDSQIYAAAVDYGQASDVSGYCTEDSKACMSSSCADDELRPLALDRSLIRRRRLDRLKRRLQHESSFATTTSLASSSDVTASMSRESDLVN